MGGYGGGEGDAMDGQAEVAGWKMGVLEGGGWSSGKAFADIGIVRSSPWRFSRVAGARF